MDKSAVRRAGRAGFDPQGCAAFLRQRHPVKTAQAVAAATGDPARTVERWLAGTATPSLRAFARLACSYGLPFLAAAIPGLAGIGRLAALATYEGLAAEIAAREAHQAELAAEILAALPPGGGRRR